jgi:hypothetical protein
VKDNNTGLSLVFAIAVIFGPLFASEAPTCCSALSEDPDAILCPDRAFALFYPRPLSPRSVLFTVEHRGRSPAFDHPLRDGLGLDNGSLKIGLGLRYSPIANVDAGIRRVNNALDLFDTYEFDLRYCLLDEAGQGFDAALGTGVSLFYQDIDGIASGYFGTVLLGRSIAGRLYLSTGALYHSNSTYSAKTLDDIDWSLCVPASVSLRVVKGLSLLAESFIPAGGYSAGKPGYACGFKYATWRHGFSLLITNSQYTTIDGMVSGSDRLNNPVIGLMITRKFGGE